MLKSDAPCGRRPGTEEVLGSLDNLSSDVMLLRKGRNRCIQCTRNGVDIAFKICIFGFGCALTEHELNDGWMLACIMVVHVVRGFLSLRDDEGTFAYCGDLTADICA